MQTVPGVMDYLDKKKKESYYEEVKTFKANLDVVRECRLEAMVAEIQRRCVHSATHTRTNPALLGAVHRRRGPTHTRPERETAAHSTYRHARCPAALSAGRAVVRRGQSRCWPVVGSIRECPIPAVFASSRRVLAATSASTACPNSVLAPLRKTSVSGSENVSGWVSSKTLVSVTAYYSFGGEVEALNTPTICRLTLSCRHQLSCIPPILASSTPP
jgi:hypothetical protein